MTLDPQRHQALLEAKLGALVREQAGGALGVFGPAGGFAGGFAGGAALVAGGEAWVLADDQPERALGRAMAWARQHRLARVNVLADRATGLLARRASQFTEPPQVWRVEGRVLVAAEPAPLPEPAEVDPRVLAFVPLIEAGGARPAVEHGVLTGEVAGLEVCRAVLDADLDVARLEVGVGAHDREAFRLMYGDLPPADALAGIVAKVAPHRQPGAPPHPLNRLAAERWLRDRLVADPSLAGLGGGWLVEAPPPLPRPNLKDAVPCVAVGADGAGAPVVVVCSVGIDLDLVPYAADARLAAGPERHLVLAVPERDVHPVTAALAERLREPGAVVGVRPV